MIVMPWFRTLRGMAIWPMLLSLLLAPACSRPAEPRPDDTAQSGQRRVPFQDSESAKGDSSLSAPPAQGNSLRPESSIPFRDFRGLPAGTLLTVRLKRPILADGRGASEAFDAIVDEPVLVEGNTLLPRGSSVAGRVEAAHASRLKRNRGYVRLKLDSIAVAGQELPVQTLSLFVNGNADESEAGGSEASPGIIRLESGRRLTFRLAEPVLLTTREATPSR
jgi:hypothetical protein